MSHRGLRDWAIQRISAVVVGLYAIFVIAYFTAHHFDVGFSSWKGLFGTHYMKAATIITLLLIMWHAWIGLWTVCTDYIKWGVLRLAVEMIILLLLLFYFFWGLSILWGFRL